MSGGDIHERITDVLAEHVLDADIECDELADVLVRELGLTQEWAATGDWRDGEVYSVIDGSRGSRENAERHKYYDTIDVISRYVTTWESTE